MTEPTLAQNYPASRALIYSATVEFRHDSIPTAIESLKAQGLRYNVQFDQTEDKSWFTDDRLAQYDAIVFLSNSGQVLDDSGEAALQKYVNLGGNFVGIHSASDCQRNSTFVDKEIGAHFDYHPEISNATVDVIDQSHPSTSMLPTEWHIFDEMYNFKSDPRSVGAVVILSANESSYTDPGPRKYNQGTPHPTAWYQERGAGVEPGGTAGRSWYTSLGHTNETWKDDLYLAHVMGGISWAIQSGTTRATNASALVGSSSSSNSSTATGTSTTSSAAPSPTAQDNSANTMTSKAASLMTTAGLSLLYLMAIFL